MEKTDSEGDGCGVGGSELYASAPVRGRAHDVFVMPGVPASACRASYTRVRGCGKLLAQTRAQQRCQRGCTPYVRCGRVLLLLAASHTKEHAEHHGAHINRSHWTGALQMPTCWSWAIAARTLVPATTAPAARAEEAPARLRGQTDHTPQARAAAVPPAELTLSASSCTSDFADATGFSARRKRGWQGYSGQSSSTPRRRRCFGSSPGCWERRRAPTAEGVSQPACSFFLELASFFVTYGPHMWGG